MFVHEPVKRKETLHNLPRVTSDMVQKNKTQTANRVKQLEKPQKQMPSTAGIEDEGQSTASSSANNEKQRCTRPPGFGASTRGGGLPDTRPCAASVTAHTCISHLPKHVGLQGLGNLARDGSQQPSTRMSPRGVPEPRAQGETGSSQGTGRLPLLAPSGFIAGHDGVG